jgi:hypothetical protein
MSQPDEGIRNKVLDLIRKGDITNLWLLDTDEELDARELCNEAILAGNPNLVLKFLITVLAYPFTMTTCVLASSYLVREPRWRDDNNSIIASVPSDIFPMSTDDCTDMVVRRRFDALRFLRKNKLNEVCPWPTDSWKLHCFDSDGWSDNTGPRNSMKLLECLIQPGWVEDTWNGGQAGMKEASDCGDKGNCDDYMCQLANLIENVQKTPSLALLLRAYVDRELKALSDYGTIDPSFARVTRVEEGEEGGAPHDQLCQGLARVQLVMHTEAFNEADVRLFSKLLPAHPSRHDWKSMTVAFNDAVVKATTEEACKPETLRGQRVLPNFKEPEHLQQFAAEFEDQADNWYFVFERGHPWSE